MSKSPVPAMEDFDFIELMIHDVHGIPRGRMMARRRMAGIVKNGLGIYGGVCYFGIRDQPNVHPDFGENGGYANKNLKPIPDTLTACPQLGDGKYKVGQVQCRLEYMDGTLDTTTPRTAATIQLERLQKEFGLTIKSAFEIEFTIRHAETKEYLGHISKWATTSVLDQTQEILMGMIKDLGEKGIHVDSIQTECGPGQFEVTLDVEEGILAADKTAKYKNAVKTYLKSKGYDASFMTRVDPCLGCSNGFHFNHSLWTADGKNALIDLSKPHKLSDLGRHWLAGLIEHAPAITAFCNPTINCYRRIGAPWAPTISDWGVGNRVATFRLKLEQGDNVYFENRLPTSACNPYFVLAATVAAGMDGLKRKLPLSEPLSKQTKLLPKDLESALKLLEADTVLTEALGKKTVEYFASTKRTFELEEFKSLGKLSEEEQIEKEREYYFHNV